MINLHNINPRSKVALAYIWLALQYPDVQYKIKSDGYLYNHNGQCFSDGLTKDLNDVSHYGKSRGKLIDINNIPRNLHI